LKLKITVDGQIYEVDVEVSEPEAAHASFFPPQAARVPASIPPVAPPAKAAAAPVADESKVCRSPFAGSVSKILAQTGQLIQAGDTLLVLEAMKMETVLTSPAAGKVKSVTVQVGDAVQGGQVLVEFE
jgi:biotin carboxyl carrier protein